MPRIDLPFPKRGLSEDVGFSEQEAGTTRLAQNVRVIDPKTGRSRGGQRPGMSKFTTSALETSRRVQAISSVSYALPKVEWTELTEFDNGSTNPGFISVEWGTVTPGEYSTESGIGAEVVWVETDPSTNRVYALTAGGNIHAYNTKGTRLKTFPVPVSDDEALIRKIVVDEEGRIYAAVASPDGEVGGQVFQWKLLDEEEDLYVLRWTLDLDGTPQNFDVRLGVLAVAMDFEEGDSFSKIRTYHSLHTQKPKVTWERACPNPVRGIHIDKSGDVFTTHPSNLLRGQSPGSEGFITSSNPDSYTVHDIGLDDSSESDARYRIHSNLMADYIVGHADGEFVNVIKDHRYVFTTDRDPSGNQQAGDQNNPPEYVSVDDVDANRLLKTFSNNSRRPGPRFRLAGAGGKPTLHFQGSRENDVNGDPMAKPGMYLRSFANERNVFKSDTGSDGEPDEDGTNKFQRSIIPGHSTGHNTGDGWGNAWLVCQVWRIPSRDNQVQVLWTQNGDPCKYALLANAKIVSGEIVPWADSIVFMSNRMTDGETINWEGDDWQGVDSNMAPSSGSETDGYYENPADMALITIGHAGWDWDGNDNPRGPQGDSSDTFTSQSFLRVNGVARKAFTMTQMASRGDDSFCVVGNPHWKPSKHPSDLFFDAPFDVHPFTGEFCQHVCVLGDTTTTANDTRVTRPGEDSSGPTTEGDIPTASEASGTVQNLPPNQAQTQTASVVEKIEGWLAHRWAIPHLLPNGLGLTGANGLYKDHPFGGATNPPLGYGDFSSNEIQPLDSDTLAIHDTSPILAKWGANAGALRWAINGSGLGNAVVTDTDRGVFTTGEKDATDLGSTTDVGDPDAIARKTIDLGPSASVDDADGAWAVTDTAAAPNFKYPCVRSDAGDDFYWAIGSSRQLRKYDGSDGTLTWTYKVPRNGTAYKARAVALDQTIPDYDDDTIKSPPFLYLGATGAAAEQDSDGVERNTLSKLRIVAETQVIGASASPRATKYVGVANGSIYTFARGGTASAPTGGSNALEPESPYVQIGQLGNKLYFVDGFSDVKKYDPKDDEVTTLDAEDAGEVPKRGVLVTGWHGRLVLVQADDRVNWHMSKVGNAAKWDLFPSVPKVTDAVSGSSARGPGESPDVINALVPATDDLLYLGCDHTIHRFTGDPLAGGQIDLVSDQTGMAFGSPWAKDRQGAIYFFGQLGSVWRLVVGGGAERISLRTIERRFQDINLLAYRIVMAWDWREEGLRIYQVPYGAGGVAVSSYFWDKKNDAWFEDTYSTTGIQATAVAVFDGDNPDDRVVAVGCEDGLVRYVHGRSPQDDGNRIDSRVVIGPISAGFEREVRVGKLQVALARDQGGCRYRLFVSDSPDEDLDRMSPVAQGILPPGLSPMIYKRGRGRYVWLEIRNADVTRWAFEGASIGVYPGPQSRVRA